MPGTSVRKVDDSVNAPVADVVLSKPEVSRICVNLDDTQCKAEVGAGKGGRGSQVALQDAVVAFGASPDEHREILECGNCGGEDKAFFEGVPIPAESP